MTANNVEQDLRERVRSLEDRLDNLLRQSSAHPYKRDLRDCRGLTKVQDGQTDVWSSALGEWIPSDFPAGGDSVTMASAANAAATLPASGSTHYLMVTPSITIPAAASFALIVSNVQLNPSAAAGDDAYMRNARSGVNDGLVGQRLCNNGGGWQPSVTRASVMPVTPGVSVQFGVFFGDLHVDTGWYSTPFTVTTAYLIS